MKMYSLVYCFAVLLIIQNSTSTKAKVYVIDLADTNPNEDKVELSKLLKILTKSRETPFKEAKLDGYVSNENDCLMDLATTKLEKIKCLNKIQRNKLGVNSWKPEFSQFYAQRPKRKIYSLYNYYGGMLKPEPVTDYTRQEFSQDYLDLGDLSRLEKCTHHSCRHSDHRRLKDVYDVSPDSRRRIVKDSEERSSSESDKSSESSEEKSDRKILRKPNRFQVVFNEDSSVESEEAKPKKPKKSYSSSEEKRWSSEEEKPKKPKKSYSSSEEKRWSSEEKKPKKSRDKFAYLQGNKIYDVRRRLQHFLPKRFHWDEDDMYHNLGYYWFDAPKNKYT